MPKRQCGTCQWFKRFDPDNKLGQCRCFPPTNTELSATWTDGEESLRWPTVPLIAWCGQWTAQE